MDRPRTVPRWTVACFLLGLAAKPALPLDYRRKMHEALRKLDRQVGKWPPKAPAAPPRTPPKSAPRTPQEAAAAAAGVREYVCPLTDGPIRLDGRLSESVWEGTPAVAAPMVRAHFLFDDDLLYIGGHVTGLAGQPRMPFGAGLAGAVVISLKPREFGVVTYRLAVPRSRPLRDAKLEPGSRNPDAWSSGAILARRPGPDGWTFEARIPFTGFGGDERPFRGDVWLAELGLASAHPARGGQQSIGEITLSGIPARLYLIFEDRNLLTNGDFETLPSTETESAPGWSYAINDDPGTAGQGSISVVTHPHAPREPHVALLDKTDQPGYWPALMVKAFPIEERATYQFSARVKSEAPFLAGVGLSTEKGGKWYYVDGVHRHPLSPTFSRIVRRYRADPRVDRAGVLFRFEGEGGKMWIDDVRLTRVNGLARSAFTVREADPIHDLVELSVRTGFKPFWRLKREDGWYENDRTVFKDTGTGATIWKMSRHPGYICRHQYMQFPPWSGNGERMCLMCLPQWWRILLKPDGSAWKPFSVTVPPNTDPSGAITSGIWDAQEPNWLWLSVYDGRTIARHDFATGRTAKVRGFSTSSAVQLPSHDGEFLLIKQEGQIHMVPRNATPEDDRVITLTSPQGVHQAWFTNRRDYSLAFSYRTCETRDGVTYAGAIVGRDGQTLREVKAGTGLHPGGHRAPSPSGKWTVHTYGFLFDWLTDEMKWVSDHRTNHQSWGPDDGWFVGSCERAPTLRRFGVKRPFDQLLGWANSRMRYNVYWSEVHPAVSPDGTKLGYVSNMLGWIDFYTLIMGLPEAPARLKVSKSWLRRKTQLQWWPPTRGRETARYRIYHAPSAAGPYESIDSVPVTETKYTTDRRAGYFTVTAQEHSGLESLYSNVVALGQPQEPLVASAEAETYRDTTAKASPMGQAHAGTRPHAVGHEANANAEIFDPSAANLYAVLLGAESPSSGITLRVWASQDFSGAVFARVRNLLVEGTARLQAIAGAKELPPLAVESPEWHWLDLSQGRPVQVRAGRTSVRLVPKTAGVVVDQILITNAPQARLRGPWGKDSVPPGQISRVTAKTMDPYTVGLRWGAPEQGSHIAHYNVYANRGATCTPSNETLIASPVKPRTLDWGLAAKTAYAYRVTAVDRAGNESEPSPVELVTTPPVTDRVFVKAAPRGGLEEQPDLAAKFELTEQSPVLFWLNVRCSKTDATASFKVLLDGEVLRESCTLPFRYITPHHGGPEAGACLWACLEKPIGENHGGRDRLFPVSSGRHTLKLLPREATADVGLELLDLVVTNDLGWLPPGIWNFLIDPTRGRD